MTRPAFDSDKILLGLPIVEQVDNELLDFKTCEFWQHGKTTGYAKGCRGPLCRWANRKMRSRARVRRGLEPLPAQELDAYLEARFAEVPDFMKALLEEAKRQQEPA